jgi:F-type H+-transporting ATPase subunit epsilon
MAEQTQFELVSPERLLFSRAVEMVVVPGTEGDMGVLPDHAPLIATVRPGVIAVFENGQVSERIFVGGGFVEITGERCTVLAEVAAPIAELDRGRIDATLKNAREDLADAKDEHARAAAERRIALEEAKLAALEPQPY